MRPLKESTFLIKSQLLAKVNLQSIMGLQWINGFGEQMKWLRVGKTNWVITIQYIHI